MKWLLYSLLCLVLWGFWGFLLKLAYRGLDWKTVYFVSTVASFLLALAFVACSGWIKISSLSSSRTWLALAAAAGLAGGGGYILFVRALQTGKASIVLPLTALYPAITVVLAAAILGEKLSPIQIAGIVLAVIACIMLSAG